MKKSTLSGGILGGLAGGVVFGAMMAMMGVLPMIGKMVGVPSAGFGFLVHMVISAAIGAGFAVVFGPSVLHHGGGVLKGMAYGALWWLLGPLTLMPLFLGMGVRWSTAAAVAALPSLVGHVIYGGVLGFVFARRLRSEAEAEAVTEAA